MLITLIRRELLDNLMTFRFGVAVLITLLLVIAHTLVGIKDYEQRLVRYNIAVKTHRQQLQGMKTYSVGAPEVIVDRAPNPLSIFNVGLDKRLGSEIQVYHAFVPTLWDADTHGTNNPFLNLFTSIDLVFIFEGLLSLLALIFAYDSITGERERSTLRLTLIHPVSRGHILFAKYVSAMLCLLVPLLVSLLFAVILLTTSASISLSIDDFFRIGGIVFVSLTYLSVFYLIGLLISVTTHRTKTALMISMFVWGFLVLVYPNLILAVIDASRVPQTQAISDFSKIKQLWERFDRDRKHFLINDPVVGEDPLFNIEWSAGFGFEDIIEDPSTLQYYYQVGLQVEKFDVKSEPLVAHARNYFRFLGPRTINTAEQTWIVRKQILENVFVRPANVDHIWLKLSPVGLYDATTQAWAGTDLLGVRDYFDAVRQYRQTVIDYLYDKKVFAIRQWFASDKGSVDWNALPQFSFQRNSVAINAKRALLDVCLLLIMNLVLFMVIFLIFVKSEV